MINGAPLNLGFFTIKEFHVRYKAIYLAYSVNTESTNVLISVTENIYFCIRRNVTRNITWVSRKNMIKKLNRGKYYLDGLLNIFY